MLATLAVIALLSWLAARWWGEPGHHSGFWLVMVTLQFIAVVGFAYRHARLPTGRAVNTPWRREYLLYTLFGRRGAGLLVVAALVWVGLQVVDGVRWLDRQAGSLGEALAAQGFTLQNAMDTLVPLLVMTLIVKLAVYLLRANLRWHEALLATGLAAVCLRFSEWVAGTWPGPMPPLAATLANWLPVLLAVLAGGWVLGRRARSLLGSPVGVPRGLVLMLAAALLGLLLLAIALLILGQALLPPGAML